MNLKNTFGAAILCCLIFASCHKDEPVKPVRQNTQDGRERPMRTIDEKKKGKENMEGTINAGILNFYIDREKGLRVVCRHKEGARITINGKDGRQQETFFDWKFDVVPEALELALVNDTGRTFKCRIPVNEVTLGLYAKEIQVPMSGDVFFELTPFVINGLSENSRMSVSYGTKIGNSLAAAKAYPATTGRQIVFAREQIEHYKKLYITNGYLNGVLFVNSFYTAKATNVDGNLKIRFDIACYEGFRLKVVK